VSGSSTTVTVQVAKVSTRTVLRTKRVGAGKAKITVRVRATGDVTPSGTVTVRVGTKTRVVTLRDGVATFTVAKAGRGRLSVRADYAGDAFGTGSSATGTVVLRG